MKRYAMTVMLKDDPEIIRRYEQYHANPFLETNEGLLRVGIKRIYIYRFLRTLFLFMETRDDFDMDVDLPKYKEHPRAREWDELMATFQETIPGAPKGSKWVQLREVYALEA